METADRRPVGRLHVHARHDALLPRSRAYSRSGPGLEAEIYASCGEVTHEGHLLACLDGLLAVRAPDATDRRARRQPLQGVRRPDGASVAGHRARVWCLGPEDRLGGPPASASDGAVSAGHLVPVQRRGTRAHVTQRRVEKAGSPSEVVSSGVSRAHETIRRWISSWKPKADRTFEDVFLRHSTKPPACRADSPSLSANVTCRPNPGSRAEPRDRRV